VLRDSSSNAPSNSNIANANVAIKLAPILPTSEKENHDWTQRCKQKVGDRLLGTDLDVSRIGDRLFGKNSVSISLYTQQYATSIEVCSFMLHSRGSNL
jgi:hypothetical protein